MGFIAPARWFTPHIGGWGRLDVCDRGSSHAVGSLSHAWGSTFKSLRPEAPIRPTPTCVGKTPVVRKCSALKLVHPHMRGEDAANERCKIASSPASSTVHPHMRGEDSHYPSSLPANWFTSTCVGKTQTAKCRNAGSYGRRGSPPHAWGRRQVTQAGVAYPAQTVHSHMRGEDINELCIFKNAERFTRGGPTCVGKTNVAHCASDSSIGSLPTCVGKTRDLPLVKADLSRRFAPTCVGKTGPLRSRKG